MNIRKHGFTLIEMIITVLIIAILAIISIQLFSPYIRKGRRIDAVNSLLSISLAEERYRSSNTAYGSLSQVWGGVSTSSEGYYTLAISNVSATTYTITATAVGNQASDTQDGTSCSALTFSMSNGTVSKTPSVRWPT